MRNIGQGYNPYMYNNLAHYPALLAILRQSMTTLFWILVLLSIPYSKLHGACSSCGQSMAPGYSSTYYGSSFPADRSVPANQCANCATCTGIPDSYRQSPECRREIPIPQRGYRAYCPKPKKHKVQTKQKVTVVTEFYCAEKPPKFKKCCPFPPRILACRTINPADIVDSTCNEFPQKLKTCQPYTCQAPSSQDPYIKTIWQIHHKAGNRCVVSNINDDLGIKDENDITLPITQICEYDKIGVIALLKRFSDMEKEFYHFSTCENFRGVHNCTYHVNGKVFKSIKDIRRPPY